MARRSVCGASAGVRRFDTMGDSRTACRMPVDGSAADGSRGSSFSLHSRNSSEPSSPAELSAACTRCSSFSARKRSHG